MSNIGHQFTLERVNSKGKASITYKFNLKGKRFMYGTSQAIIPELWDKSNQRPTGNKKIIDHYQKDHPQIKTELKNINQRLENLTSLIKTLLGMRTPKDLSYLSSACPQQPGVDESLGCVSVLADVPKGFFVQGMGIGTIFLLTIDQSFCELWIIHVVGKDAELDAISINTHQQTVLWNIPERPHLLGIETIA